MFEYISNFQKIWPSENVDVGKFVVGKFVSKNLLSENSVSENLLSEKPPDTG